MKQNTIAERHRSMGITRLQIASFRTVGYAYVSNYFSLDVALGLRELSDRLSAQAASILNTCRADGVSLSSRAKAYPMEPIVVAEATSCAKVCRYEYMMGSDPCLKEFIRTNVQQAVSELVGENVAPFKDKTNEKLPGGGAFGPHQDIAAYQSFKPRYHATALLTIDPATVQNGCVEIATNCREVTTANSAFVVATINNRPLLYYNEDWLNHGDIRPDIAAKLQWQPLQTRPLDLVVFDSFVPHFSSVNSSKNPRRAIFVTYNVETEGSWYEEYYADKRLNYDDPKFHVSTPTSRRDNTVVPFREDLN